jgi:hypothetical protein
MTFARALPLAALAALLVAGCGGGHPTTGASATTASTATTPTSPATTPATVPGKASDATVRKALHLPARVPLRATGPAPAAQVRVVTAWFDRLRGGDSKGAAALFAVPSVFQNIDAIAKLRSHAEAEIVMATLPCGAKVLTTHGANGYVVYGAILTNRKGGDCGTGAGGHVRGAIRVVDGHITEWYRLPDKDGGGASPQPSVAGGPVV